jgi:predicted Fe-Mo cluster-binding NifX family protein
MSVLSRLFVMILTAVVLGTPAIADDSAYKQDLFAIAADGSEPSSAIAKLSGIAPFYHIYDMKGNLVEVLPNPHLDLEFGTGPAAAATLADKGVTVLVGGMAGPKMQDVLDAKHVRFVQRVGTVEDVVEELKEE